MALEHDEVRPVLGTATGGISGPALKPISLAMVYKTYQAVEIPIIGVGGIETTNDALDYIYAGAQAIQIGTANFSNPRTPQEILSGLLRHLIRNKVASTGELVSLSHNAILPSAPTVSSH